VPPPPVPTSPADRVRIAWHTRAQSDYIFNFATALGWFFLTLGVYGVYIIYQLIRRSRDHNRRRIEMLDGATSFAWEQAQSRGLADELRPNFEEIGRQMATLREIDTRFRDPTVWAVLSLFFSTIVDIVAFCLLDGDLITHDYAEGAIENELSTIYGRLGSPVAAPDPGRLRTAQNYVGRIIVTIVTCGIYLFWWMYDVMTDGNKHFEQNWAWEDSLANAVQQLLATA
jgi:hypothetical protein